MKIGAINILILSFVCFAPFSYADVDAGKEAYFMGEYDRAHTELLPEAEKGDSYAQIKIGQMYENDWGVERDFTAAHHWYERAANGNDPEGLVALAKLYGYGRGVIKDYNTAEAYLLKAVELGHYHAYYVLGDFHNDDYAFGHNDQHALKYYLLAAEHNAAANSVNGHFRKGSGQWFRLITAKGVQMTRNTADTGNVYAQLNTGLRYYFGEGVIKNHNTANTYLLMAALAGNLEAQNYLAQNRVLQSPMGFDKVFVDKWFTIAAMSGDKLAQKNKLNVENEMTAQQISKAEDAAKKWLAGR